MDRFVADLSKPDIALSRVKCDKVPCRCDKAGNFDTPCGMTAERAREFVARYYRMKAEYVEGMTIEAFLHDYAGIYP